MPGLILKRKVGEKIFVYDRLTGERILVLTLTEQPQLGVARIGIEGDKERWHLVRAELMADESLTSETPQA